MKIWRKDLRETKNKMKNGMKLLAFLVLGLMLVATVSAYEFDNVKSYDPIKKEVTITNAFGFGETLLKAKLTSEEVVIVPQGYQKVAEMEIETFKKDLEGMGDLSFYDKKNKDTKTERTFDFKYAVVKEKSIDKIEYVCNEIIEKNGSIGKECSNEKVGKEIINETEWITFKTLSDLPKKDNVKIGIFTNVRKGDYVEWIPEFYGKKITEWAVWSESLDADLISYWTFNESSGTIIDIHQGKYNLTARNTPVYNQDGVIGTAVKSYDNNDVGYDGTIAEMPYATILFSVAGWLNMTGNSANAIAWGMGTTSSDNDLIILQMADTNTIKLYNSWNGDTTITETGDSSGDGEYHHYAITFDGTNMYLYIDGVLNVSGATNRPSNTPNTFRFGVARRSSGYVGPSQNTRSDEWGFWNRTLSADEITDLYNNGEGLYYGARGIAPSIEQNSPEDAVGYSSSPQTINFNCSATDDSEVINITLFIDGVLNYTETGTGNPSLELYKSYDFTDGNYNWSCDAEDDLGLSVSSDTRTFSIDETDPEINLTIAGGGSIFGYPNNLSINYSISDLNADACGYWTNQNITNTSISCTGTNFTLENVDAGNWEVYVWANDTFGHITLENINTSINYYTHNISFGDNVTNATLTPSCVFDGITYSSYPYKMNILNTTERNLTCNLATYLNSTFTLSESNMSSERFYFEIPYLWLIFDEGTNATMTWLGGGKSYDTVTEIKIAMRNLTLGDIVVSFNENNQLFSFINDNSTNIKEYLHVETPDLDQQVKVLSSSNEIANALVTMKKTDNSSVQITYSAYTDINGVAHLLVDDGTTYELHVEKSGYGAYSELVYIPHSNTETIIVNLIEDGQGSQPAQYSTSCTPTIGESKNCSFSVKTYETSDITFNYTWNGSNYEVTSSNDDEATLTLWADENTTNLEVDIYINDELGKSFSVGWESLGARAIQLIFNEDEIKDESYGILGLFYLIVFIIGILLTVSINRMPKAKGWGGVAFMVWIGIVALGGFPMLWFIAIPGGLYFIFKKIWGEEE